MTAPAQRDLFASIQSKPVPFHEVLPGDDTYFASGSNHAGEIRGLNNSQVNIGVCAPKIGKSSEAELIELASSGLGSIGMLRIFIDSGAFSEVSFESGRPQVVKPITDAKWKKVLDLYFRLGTHLRRQLFVVAPDQVAFQAETLARIERYAPQLRELIAMDVNVIIPLQKGELSMPEFAIKVVDILGTFDLIWGIPSKKDATKLTEVAAFADWLSYSQLPEIYRPGISAVGADPVDTGTGWIDAGNSRVHLLGLGPSSPRFRAVYNAIRKASPLTTIFSDSVRITALVGHGEARKDGSRTPRPLTAARAAVIAEGQFTEVADVKAASLYRVMRSEYEERLRAARRGGWYDDELESAPGVPLEDGCIDYGPKGPFGEIPTE